jgi:hypothetical protein
MQPEMMAEGRSASTASSDDASLLGASHVPTRVVVCYSMDKSCKEIHGCQLEVRSGEIERNSTSRGTVRQSCQTTAPRYFKRRVSVRPQSQ